MTNLNTDIEFDLDNFNDDSRCEYNYFKIYKHFLFIIVRALKYCKYTYDTLKEIGVFTDDDDKIYVFDKLIKYYYSKMNDEYYSGVLTKLNKMLDNSFRYKLEISMIDCYKNKICPKLQKKENNYNINCITNDMKLYFEIAENYLLKYTDWVLCTESKIIVPSSNEYQQFKKLKPSINKYKPIFTKIRADINNKFFKKGSKKYVGCFGIGIDNVIVDYSKIVSSREDDID